MGRGLLTVGGRLAISPLDGSIDRFKYISTAGEVVGGASSWRVVRLPILPLGLHLGQCHIFNTVGALSGYMVSKQLRQLNIRENDSFTRNGMFLQWLARLQRFRLLQMEQAILAASFGKTSPTGCEAWNGLTSFNYRAGHLPTQMVMHLQLID